MCFIYFLIFVLCHDFLILFMYWLSLCETLLHAVKCIFISLFKLDFQTFSVFPYFKNLLALCAAFATCSFLHRFFFFFYISVFILSSPISICHLVSSSVICAQNTCTYVFVNFRNLTEKKVLKISMRNNIKFSINVCW